MLNALILLACDEGKYQRERSINETISRVLNVSMKTIDRVKKRFVEEGFDVALTGKPSTCVYHRKADGDLEAHLIALSCSAAPEGRQRWTLRLLADKAVELHYVDNISYETVREGFKKNVLKPWKQDGWVIPPLSDGNFVAHMEMVLDVYKQPYDPLYPVVCISS